MDATLYTDVTPCVSGERRLHNPRLVGTLWDLYDFNYFDTNIFVKDIVEAMASIQAGFGSFGAGRTANAGQVFQVIVNLDWPLPDHENRAAGPCVSSPPQDCTSIAGAWTANTTYTWRCHGSFAPLSREVTRITARTISEDAGCQPRFGPPVIRSGRGSDTTLGYVRGIAAGEVAPLNPEFPYNAEINAYGTILNAGRRIDFSEYGVVLGYAGGKPGRCITDANSVWSR